MSDTKGGAKLGGGIPVELEDDTQTHLGHEGVEHDPGVGRVSGFLESTTTMTMAKDVTKGDETGADSLDRDVEAMFDEA